MLPRVLGWFERAKDCPNVDVEAINTRAICQEHANDVCAWLRAKESKETREGER